jgi:hypothetical protein
MNQTKRLSLFCFLFVLAAFLCSVNLHAQQAARASVPGELVFTGVSPKLMKKALCMYPPP